MRKCANISPYMRRPLVIFDFATAPLWISLNMRENLIFFFISVQYVASLPCMLLPDYFILRQAIELVLLKASQPRLWARSWRCFPTATWHKSCWRLRRTRPGNIMVCSSKPLFEVEGHANVNFFKIPFLTMHFFLRDHQIHEKNAIWASTKRALTCIIYQISSWQDKNLQ